VLVTQDAQGQPISSFAYYFHVVAEDTQGNLTRQAASYLIQIGTQPTTRNVFGYVRDGASNPISYAQVSLQPYALYATTDINGYFLFNSVYDGSYVITTKKSGFQDGVSSITVNASLSPYNVILTP
jgi:hypothetical protein